MKITVLETINVPSELEYSTLGFHFFNGNFAHPRSASTEFATLESATAFVKSRKERMADVFKYLHSGGLNNEDTRNFQKTDTGCVWEEYRPYGNGWIAPNGCGHQSQKWFKLEYAVKIEIV